MQEEYGRRQGLVEIAEPYDARPVAALGTWRCGQWRIKKYTIAYAREAARPELVAAAEAAAVGVLPEPAVAPRGDPIRSDRLRVGPQCRGARA